MQRVNQVLRQLWWLWAREGFTYIKKAGEELLGFLACITFHSSADR